MRGGKASFETKAWRTVCVRLSREHQLPIHLDDHRLNTKSSSNVVADCQPSFCADEIE